MRSAQTRGTVGRPETDPPRAGESVAEKRIKDIFRQNYRSLAALFPSDGETMVTRAMYAAVAASREVISTGEKKGALRFGSVAPESIAEKVMACHHLGLEVGDQAYLVPYGGEVSLIIGPRGLVALMMRSGFVKSIVARSVFQADVAAGLFSYDLGSKPFVKHQKAPESRRAGNIVATYAIVETTTEGQVLEVLTWEDIEYYRSFSKTGGGAWDTAYEGMCRKTAIKRVAEFIPRSPILSQALRENEHGAYEIPEEILNARKPETTLPRDEPAEEAKASTAGTVSGTV